MPLDNNFRDYDEYWNDRGFNKPGLKRAKKMSPMIEPRSKILDIGFGDGAVMEYLITHNKAAISNSRISEVCKKIVEGRA